MAGRDADDANTDRTRAAAPSPTAGSPASPTLPEALRGDGYALSVGHACYRHLTWECALRPPAIADGLAAALLSRGYTDASHSPLVRVLSHPVGHQVVMVPRTGRVQLRVHYLVPFEGRAAAAHAVASELAQLARGSIK